ncbi:hypothetical protein [Clostridium vincentii]|uniref:Uncharacterized protein n=1 Tax=Clostridium vincentii TaxID=52704 RepID=A0A2T0BB33_9CLOT|nr:hypothetical protein [Clostridium vincentii]PRR81109.1 hypothetical protein CLVI_27830 [Clostridium vincentii]
MKEEINLQGLNGIEVWKSLYNKELDTKKNVLEYIEEVKVLKNGDIDHDQIEMVYNMIYENIESMAANIKPNTTMFLKNDLKKQLGKYVSEKDPKATNHFLEFFKEAYPPKERRKDFTWVLMDITKIADEQIWTTLKFINAFCLKGFALDNEAKKDILNVLQILVKRKNLTSINNVRSLSRLNEVLDIKIVSDHASFRIKKLDN